MPKNLLRQMSLFTKLKKKIYEVNSLNIIGLINIGLTIQLVPELFGNFQIRF